MSNRAEEEAEHFASFDGAVIEEMTSFRRSETNPLLASSQSSVTSAHEASLWRNDRFPEIFVNTYIAVESAYNRVMDYVPPRVLAFGGGALLFGMFVLVHTSNLVTTANIPKELLRAVPEVVITPPVIHANALNCTELYFEQKIDHFAWLPAGEDGNSSASALPATYQQRYLINDLYWDPTNKKAPIFFYTGNEGDVTLYANNTGLMWENAEDFHALIVFAEHRYYGKSLPFGDDFMNHLQYLNHEQALADFTELIFYLQEEYKAKDHAVIAFGGSYGGMLSAWFRMKYPSIVHGAIAASAPIFAFAGYPQFKGDDYWKVVTRDASPATGAAENCVPNVKKAWDKIFTLAKSGAGRNKLTEIFRLCDPLPENAGDQLAMSVMVAFDTLAMGNFPYPSSYLTNGAADLPPWPVREACSHLAGEFKDGNDDELLLAALRDASNVYNNATQDLQCFKLPTLEDFDGIWDWQWCTEMLPQETYFNTNGETDMFWPRNITLQHIQERCQRVWKTTPDPNWIRVSYGDESLRYASNIVFSNGLLDPWSSGGVHHVPKGSKLTIVTIEEGAHHIDLFFTHPKDPESVTNARKTEIAQIRKWINEYASG